MLVNGEVHEVIKRVRHKGDVLYKGIWYTPKDGTIDFTPGKTKESPLEFPGLVNGDEKLSIRMLKKLIDGIGSNVGPRRNE